MTNRCSLCYGTGKIDQYNDYSVKYDPCPKCKGTGIEPK